MTGPSSTRRTETLRSWISSVSSSSVAGAKARKRAQKQKSRQQTYRMRRLKRLVCFAPAGVVTAEMCQDKEDSDLLSKMVEDLDEVRGHASLLTLYS